LGERISLVTIQYIDGNVQKGGRLTPRLVGFMDDIEREFFEMFCSVTGVGVKKALRAMVRPPQDIARAIEQKDVKSLSTLPGIGGATAEKIVAALRRKMAKFALIVPRDDPGDPVTQLEQDLVEQTYQILITLGHTELDARKQLERILGIKKKFDTVDDLLQAVYENSRP
jgi:Holliday junction DNA helicase RuvA